MRRSIVAVVLVLVASGLCLAQRGRFRSRYRPPEVILDRNGVPTWEVDKEFPEDVFTFVRIMYGGGYGKWAVDYPDSDLNFPFRLQQLTSLKVTPDPIILELTDPRLFDYPFVYIIEPGGPRGYLAPGMNLSAEEAEALRRYCFNGGFVMVDDFWGESEWENFYLDYKKVFPDREPKELPLEHEIFHCVYDLKQKPQVPSIGWVRSGRTYETWDSQEPHYRAVFDDNDRVMMIICHNTDLGDGWEREAEDAQYFREFSEKWAYPMGINIVFYAMTH